jgi:hypothetical protein
MVYAAKRERMTCLGVLGTLLPVKKGSQHFEKGLSEQQGQGSSGLGLVINYR